MGQRNLGTITKVLQNNKMVKKPINHPMGQISLEIKLVVCRVKFKLSKTWDNLNFVIESN
jgi:hypothetical protein